MKKFFSITAVILAVAMWPMQILAATNINHLVISEIQTGSLSDASKEFVELYNPAGSSFIIDNWTVEYASSAGTTWTKKATLYGAIPSYGFYLISTSGYVAADATMSSGLASAGGHVRIKDANGIVIDTVGWGTAAHAETRSVDAPVAGGSIERLPGRLSDLAGNGQDGDDNSSDFVLRDVAEPQNKLAGVEDPSLVVSVPPDPVDVTPPDEVVITPPVYLPDRKSVV